MLNYQEAIRLISEYLFLGANINSNEIAIDVTWEYPFGWLFTFKSVADTSQMSEIEVALNICEVPHFIFIDKINKYIKYISIMSRKPYYGNIPLQVKDYALSKDYIWKPEWEVEFDMNDKSVSYLKFE